MFQRILLGAVIVIMLSGLIILGNALTLKEVEKYAPIPPQEAYIRQPRRVEQSTAVLGIGCYDKLAALANEIQILQQRMLRSTKEEANLKLDLRLKETEYKNARRECER